MSVETTAYHESGHAVVAYLHGATIHFLTVAPEYDEDAPKWGDIEVHWPRSAVSDKDYVDRAIDVALAGPAAEMIYTGEPFHPAFPREWAGDWSIAWELAELRRKSAPERLRLLEQRTHNLYQQLSEDRLWQVISSLADELLAHEHLEAEQTHEIIAQWI